MKKSLILTLILLSSAGFAKTGFIPSFISTYPEVGMSELADCMTCHTIDKWQRNAYGKDLQKWLRANDPNPNNDFDNPSYSMAFISEGLKAIEHLDSDGDGVTNLEEIQNLRFPGEADN